VTNFFDPGADTLTQWEVDWGDGTVETYDPAVGSFVHTYDRDLSAQVIVTAIDEDGRHAGQPIDQQVKYKHILRVEHGSSFADNDTFSGTVLQDGNNQPADGVEVIIKMTEAERVRSEITLEGADWDATAQVWILKTQSQNGGKFSFRLRTSRTDRTYVSLTFEAQSAQTVVRDFTLKK
jgi:hypothetical protein